ncbi:DUF5110 domain-containing protein [Lactobacillus rodentium]|uniref:Alpha-glucosidase n=1 Tax=Lactobacillus rodentium TaxID=947835 RepID=A0A2Z6TGP2_9LACO|nr:TIM-barrel domain-containing protein [Lactobacillus rodentium]MCR1894913.1 DUF5110 domain-containing protein [Lactobacillus rodentium]GBG05252.1 alpha-glucosidase [Lactobacillus rodentium]
MTENMTQNLHSLERIVRVAKGTRFYELEFASGEKARFYIIAPGIFRFIVDPSGNFAPLNPELTIPANNFSLESFEASQVLVTDETFTIKSGQYSIRFHRNPAIFSIFDDQLHRYRMMQASPLELGPNESREILRQNKNEFYYGGGMQNGRFSHKGKIIEIKNTNLSGDGAVAVPISFFWSNAGFGELRNTWQNGLYDFGSDNNEKTIISHQTPIFDNFYLLGDSPAAIINQYYRITGHPLFLPKYALGLGYMSDFVDTKWAEADPKETNAIKFEDGNTYRPTKDDNEVYALSSLNGEEKYQFSARAMAERFTKHHVDLSWFVPNYNNQQELPESSVEHLTEFANDHDLIIGFYKSLPAGSAPNFLVAAKDKPNIGNEKIIQNIAQATDPLIKASQNERPWTMAENGWTAIQTLSASISGNVGGEWEELATQVASFLGLSLSGQPNMGSAIDGIYGGNNAQVNVRDFEWKIFTPLLFNIDGWGNIQKTPFAFNSKITRINRAYLELRQYLTPYLYALTYAAQSGNPIIRPFFLEFPHEKINYTEQVKHEFMFGNNILVAPIINGREDYQGNSIKDNLYLPDHRTFWIDPFTGEKLIGGRVYDKMHYPLWHLPLFVRSGSILQEGLREATIFPQGTSKQVLYADDGHTNAYEQNEFATTSITSQLDDNTLKVTVSPTTGNYEGLEQEQLTKLNLLVDKYPGELVFRVNDQVTQLNEFGNYQEFEEAESGYFYNPDYLVFPQFQHFSQTPQPAIQIKLPKADISKNKYEISIDNYHYGDNVERHAITDSALSSPHSASISSDRLTSRSISVSWVNPSDFAGRNIKADIEVNGIIHTNIDGNSFTFHSLEPNTRYRFRIRNKFGNKVSDWTEYFGAKTKRDQMDYAIPDIQVTSNLTTSDNEMPLTNLVDHSLASEWLVNDKVSEDQPLELTFTFDQAYKLSRMVYVPRSRDRKGHILRAQIAISTDGENYSNWSDDYNWPNDAKNKVIGLRDVVAKSIKLRILKTSDDNVSAKEILFFVAKHQ